MSSDHFRMVRKPCSGPCGGRVQTLAYVKQPRCRACRRWTKQAVVAQVPRLPSGRLALGDLATCVGVSRRAINRQVNRGFLPAIKTTTPTPVGPVTRWEIDPADADRWLFGYRNGQPIEARAK